MVIHFTVFKNGDSRSFNNVWAIIEDRKGNIWLGGSIITDKKGNVLIVDAGLWRYNGKTVVKVSNKGASAMIQDSKGNIWTTGSINPNGVGAWALSRYDQKSLYDQKPAVTEVMSIKGPGMLCGIVEAEDGSIWFGALGSQSGVYRFDGNTVTDFRKSEKSN